MENLNSLVSGFFFNCRFEKQLNEKTIKAYTTDVEQFKAFLRFNNVSPDLSEINRDVLKNYIQALDKFEPKTIKRKIATIKALFNFAEFEEESFNNPFRKIRVKIKEPFNLPVVMSLAEIKKIFKAAYRCKDQIKNSSTYKFKEKVRDIAVLELLFASGIRVSELCSLKNNDVDLKTGVIIVNGKGNKKRIVQICNHEIITALKTYKTLFNIERIKDDCFFINRLGNPLSPQSVRYMVKKYSRLAKIEKHVTPHTFRHTFATLLLEEDVDIKYIQHLLGHSTILTTQIYTHVNKKKQKKILTAKHPRKHFSSLEF